MRAIETILRFLFLGLLDDIANVLHLGMISNIGKLRLLPAQTHNNIPNKLDRFLILLLPSQHIQITQNNLHNLTLGALLVASTLTLRFQILKYLIQFILICGHFMMWGMFLRGCLEEDGSGIGVDAFLV